MIRFFTFLVLVTGIVSCSNTPDSHQVQIHEQGVFEFLAETGKVDQDKELPSHIDPEAVLCFGKGLKVGRCISKQLETGICIGLIKHNKDVIALEIPCESVKRDSIPQEIFME